MVDDRLHAVAVVGAGPAGLFATRALAANGCRVLLLNRDVKPGGLAEYGIFLNKYKMKGGLRKQFQKILTDPHVTYLGHVTVAQQGALTVPDLAELGFDALVFAIGAQGTKYLGIEGERLPGAYHAKDLVYHYNRLPPFSERPFPIGRRVAIVGVGNVMVDIANYCIHFCECAEVIAVARRGPFEKAYDDREFEDIEDGFDRELYRQELQRIRPRLEAVGQDPDELLKALAAKPEPHPRAHTRLRFCFLASPKRVVAEGGRVVGLEVEETRLERKGDRVAAVGTGESAMIPCDTVVFAVGDRVDPSAGLPYKDGLYVTAPGGEPAAAYQVWDPAAQRPLTGIFVVGWARRASDGVVGRARLDAETGIKHVLEFLAGRPQRPAAEAERLIAALTETLAKRGVDFVTHADVQQLEAVEKARAQAEKIEEFKFASDREMLAALGR
ncbi:MAG TPA: FAD-dependent oxidoreductase [Methylomirabilota bacterium]|jgi:ferredoxin--NADP+ reductase|nr:FAD-dependent oxidoreductase [Methylomirabilota bacterium]